VDLDAGAQQLVEDLERTVVHRGADEPLPDHGIHRMHGDMQRGEVLRHDACDILLAEIRERDEVPRKERQAVVVVTHVQRTPETLRKL